MVKKINLDKITLLVKDRMSDLKIKQDHLSHSIGVKRPYLNAFLNGRRSENNNMRIETLDILSDMLNLTESEREELIKSWCPLLPRKNAAYPNYYSSKFYLLGPYTAERENCPISSVWTFLENYKFFYNNDSLVKELGDRIKSGVEYVFFGDHESGIERLATSLRSSGVDLPLLIMGPSFLGLLSNQIYNPQTIGSYPLIGIAIRNNIPSSSSPDLNVNRLYRFYETFANPIKLLKEGLEVEGFKRL